MKTPIGPLINFLLPLHQQKNVPIPPKSVQNILKCQLLGFVLNFWMTLFGVLFCMLENHLEKIPI